MSVSDALDGKVGHWREQVAGEQYLAGERGTRNAKA